MTEDRSNAALVAAYLGINGPHFRNSRFHSFAEEFDLFEAPVSHADQYARHDSALSPAAYFVDLVRLLDEHTPETPGVPRNDLQARRPDLWELPLDRAHTVEQMPFLEIVNDVIRRHLIDEQKVEGPEEEKRGKRKRLARERLAAAWYPFGMPFNYPLLEIRTYVTQLGVELTDVYECFQMEGQDGWVAEALGLSPVEIKRLGAPATPAAQRGDAGGLPEGQSLPAYSNVEDILERTGLTPDEFTELVQLFGLSIVPEGPAAPVRIQMSLPLADGLNRFIQLSRRLGWSFSDLDCALRSIGSPRPVEGRGWEIDLSRLARLKRLGTKYKLPVDVLCSFIHEMSTRPGVATPGKAPARSLFDRIFNTPPFFNPDGAAGVDYHPKGAGYPDSKTEPLHWDSMADDQNNQGIRSSLLACLNVGDDDLQAIVDHLSAYLKPKDIVLDVSGLTGLYRFSGLARLLGMPLQEYLVLLKCIGPLDGLFQLGESEHRLDDLRAVSDWSDWLKETGLSPYQLEYLTTGTPSAEAQSNLGFPTREQLAALTPFPNCDQAHRQATINRLADVFHQDSRIVTRALDYVARAVATDAQSQALALLLYLAKALDLSADVFDAVLSFPQLFSLDSAGSLIRLGTLRSAHTLSELVKSFGSGGSEGQSIASDLALMAIRGPEHQDAVCATLSTLGGWEVSQVWALQTRLRETATWKGGVQGLGLDGLAAMLRCFDLAAKLGAGIPMLIQLTKLADDADGAGWLAGSSATAHNLLGAVKAKYTRDEWDKTFGPIRDRLNELERDALAALLLQDLREEAEEQQPGQSRFDTLRSLSEFLLIDVEMSGCARTSYVKEAIGCVQTYIERCRMHLEDATLSPEIPDSLWSWMASYRMWEANRKVFFYPENYLEPGQRKQATPLFQELQSELLQGDITDEAVTDAYINYFDKLDELASLEIVDGHVAQVTNPQTDTEDTLFLIARTSGDPPVFYYRSAVLDRTKHMFRSWTPWGRIDLNIPVREVRAVYTSPRLYIYWAEPTTKKETTKQTLDGTNKKLVTTTATIKYSYQKVSGRWLQPQKYPLNPSQTKQLEIVGAPPESTVYDHAVCVLPVPYGQPTANGRSASLLVHEDLSIRIGPDGLADVLRGATSGKTLGSELAALVPRWRAINEGLTATAAQALAVTPDGRFLFAGTPGLGVFGRNLGDESGAASWKASKMAPLPLTALAVAPDGKTLFAGSSGQGGLWRTPIGTGGLDASWDQIHKEAAIPNVMALAVTPDGRTLFAGTWGGGVCRYTVANSEWIPLNTGLTGMNAHALVVTPDGRTLFAGVESAGVFSRKVADEPGVAWQQQGMKGESVNALAVTPDGRTLFAGVREGVFRRTGIDEDAPGTQLPEPHWTYLGTIGGDVVVSLVVSPDGRTLFAGSDIKVARLILEDGTEDSGGWLAFTEGLTGKAVGALAVTPDGRTLFAGTNMGGVFRFPLGSIDMTPDGRTLFACRWEEEGVFLGVPTGPITNEKSLVLLPAAASAEPQDWGPLTTQAARAFRDRLVNGGLDSLLSLPSQEDLAFEPGDPYAIYFSEIFFHIPFLIADALSGNRQFEHARKWYHYILDPTRPDRKAPQAEDADDGYGVWRYRPFRENTMVKLAAVLHEGAYLDELAKDAFDPHAIAQTRLGAYEKAVAMKYLDNLLGWADMLFAQDTWEAIDHAVLLYFNALNLLGPKPKPHWTPPPATAPVNTAAALSNQHTPKVDLAEILAASSAYRDPFFDVPAFFCLPENDLFAGYWDRVQDSLYKIRHCMNIQGAVRQLALFEPPIDPRQLIRAIAAGQDIAAVPKVTPEVPHYRFTVLLRQAKDMTATVMQLGSALLSALEKKDREDLNLLRSTQEQAILTMTRSVKEAQVRDGAKHLESLQYSLAAAQHRADYFGGLIADGNSDGETASLVADAAAAVLHYASVELNGLSVAGHLAPSIFGLADGGMQVGHAVAAGAQVAGSAAAALQTAAGMAATIAQFKRRREDWTLQKDLAGYDVQQIQAEIDGAGIRQRILERDLEVHDKTAEQARERDDFYRKKFGNSDLYRWMAQRLATVYFQAYTLAFDLARSAETAYQYENHTAQAFLSFGYWDNLKKGLLAGESLMLALHQLEKAHLDGDARELEIAKTISLLQLAPLQLLHLKREGKCTFELDERLFDNDFPGHYFRRIKSVSISIPAVVGPYQNVQATLTQTSNRVLLKDDPAAALALLAKQGLTTDTTVLRSSSSPQRIAITRGIDDDGMFQLDFRDERYLPFEGTGAISDWELEMPMATNRIDFNSISDVIIHLRYTALFGDKALRDGVIGQLRKDRFSGTRLVSVRQEFSTEWNRAKPLELTETMFPANLQNIALGPASLFVFAKDAPAGVPEPKASINPVAMTGSGPRKWTIPVTPGLMLDDVDDLVLLIPYTADLQWGVTSPGTS